MTKRSSRPVIYYVLNGLAYLMVINSLLFTLILKSYIIMVLALVVLFRWIYEDFIE